MNMLKCSDPIWLQYDQETETEKLLCSDLSFSMTGLIYLNISKDK